MQKKKQESVDPQEKSQTTEAISELLEMPPERLQNFIESYCHKPTKRISWDSRWLAEATLASMRSIDARTKCGAVAVKDNIALSSGYNGPIRNVWDGAVPNYEYNDLKVISKDLFHAEDNCIMTAARKGISLAGATMYITAPPCVDCLKRMYQVGIKNVIVPKDPLSMPSVCLGPEYEQEVKYFNHLTKNALSVTEVECNIKIDIS